MTKIGEPRRPLRLFPGGAAGQVPCARCARATASCTPEPARPPTLEQRAILLVGPAAICAVAASMLTAAYHMLKNGLEYRDLGADHFSPRDRSKAIQRLMRRLNDLGCESQLTPLAA